MDMVGHNHESVKFILSENARIVMQSLHDQIGNGRVSKIERTRTRLIKKTIHRGKCLSGWKRASCEGPMGRQAIVEAPGEKYRLLGKVDVRKTATIERHNELVPRRN
jgi:hypothetical protein